MTVLLVVYREITSRPYGVSNWRYRVKEQSLATYMLRALRLCEPPFHADLHLETITIRSFLEELASGDEPDSET
jgi:hypothetical protein